MFRVKGIAFTVPALLAASTLAAAEPAWITESNKQALPLLEELAKYNPEAAPLTESRDTMRKCLMPNLVT